MRITKEQLRNLTNFLDERLFLALDQDKRMGNEESATFLPNNPDYIYYKAILETLQFLGIEWKSENGKHMLFV